MAVFRQFLRAAPLVSALAMCGAVPAHQGAAMQAAPSANAVLQVGNTTRPLRPENPMRGRGQVFIQPLGPVPRWQINTVRAAIESTYGFDVSVLPARALPDAAFHAPRNRYRADRLLDDLDAHAPVSARPLSRVLGLTTRDISTTKANHADWGIFGLGRLPGRSAVLSSKRLEPRGGTESGPENRALWERRLRVMAIHELGHTLALTHCDEESVSCPMRSAEGSVDNADESFEGLGPSCRAHLAEIARPRRPQGQHRSSRAR